MTDDPAVPAGTNQIDPILDELTRYHALIREGRAKLAEDRRLIVESQQAIEESKKRLTTKPQKL